MVMPRKIIKALLPTVALAMGGMGVSQAYTLKDAMLQTFSNSPDVFITTNNRDAIDRDVRRAYSGYLPVVDMVAGYGRETSDNSTTRGVFGDQGSRSLTRTDFTLTASQVLFDGLAVYHDVAGNKARVRAAAWRVNGAAQDVALDVVTPYLEINLYKELVRLAKVNLDAHRKIYSQIQKRSEGGIGRKADLDQAEGRLALAHSNLMAQEANLKDAEANYLRTVGVMPPSYLEQPSVPAASFPSTENQAISMGLSNNPILIATFEDVAVTKAAYKQARAPFSPRFDFEFNLDRSHNIDGTRGDNDESSAMLRVRWNMFRGGSDLANLCEKAYRTNEAKEVSNRAHRQVVEAVKLAWNTYSTAKRQIPYLKQHAEASERTRDAYLKQFNIGQRTLLDLLDSENELFAARSAYTEGKHNLLLGAFRVLNATGHITDYVGISLPKQVNPKPLGTFDGTSKFFNTSSTAFDS